MELIDVASPNFFVHSADPFKKIYRYDEATNTTILIYTVLISGCEFSRFGYVCDEKSNTCKETELYPYASGIYIRVTEMDCSEPYDKVVGRLEDALIHMHVVGDDKNSVYTLNDSYE